MGIKGATFAAVLVGIGMAGMVAAAQGAAWEKVVQGKRERVDIDTSRIARGEDGRVLAWTRLTLSKSMTDPETGTPYNTVEALNSYDCAGSRFAIVKRLYLRGETLLRSEPLLTPHEMAVGAGGIDAALLAEACKSRPLADGKKAAGTAARPAAEIAGAKPAPSFGVMHAEMVTDGTNTLKTTRVAESAAKAEGKGAEAAADAAAPKRFIELPKIDKSKLEQPTDAAKESAKAAIEERHVRERMLATSGPRRLVLPRKTKPEPAPAVEVHRDIQWSYGGEGGPSSWGTLRPHFATCASGKRQSPIDIRDGIIKVDQEKIQFDYKPTLFRIVDTGRTIEVGVSEGNTIKVMGRTYELQQFHFHRPAEERIAGRAFDMVVHLVHQDYEGHQAVVAVLLEKGGEQPLIQTLWNNMPLEVGQELLPATAIDLNNLLPSDRSYFSYMGSMTTPPCTEGVLWLVFRQPLQVSPEQIATFSRLYRNNARPIQPANGRLIKESR